MIKANYLLVFHIKRSDGGEGYVNMPATIGELTMEAVRAYEREIMEMGHFNADVTLINAIRLDVPKDDTHA